MRKKKKSNNQQLNINKSVEIDYEKLAKCITNAIIESKDEVEKLTEQKEEEIDRNWRKTIGLKEYKQNEKLFKRWAIDISNFYHMMKTLVFYKRNYAQDVRMTFPFMAMISSMIFNCLRLLFILLSLSIIYLVVTATIPAWSLIFLLLTLLFAQIMHIIAMEIDQMENNEMINMVFSSLMAFIAALFTVISFVYSISH